MSKTAAFKGYTIQSRPHYDANWQKWQVRTLISYDGHRGIRTRDFSSMVLYATEEEADFHGIAFSEHLIDGKVEGHSVMDLKSSDRLAMPRLRVQFSTTFLDATKIEGMGLMFDLSSGGCRLESQNPMIPGLSLELWIHVPDLDWPLRIEAASVQWVAGQTFGLAFFQMTERERQRLEQVIRKLLEGELRACHDHNTRRQ